MKKYILKSVLSVALVAGVWSAGAQMKTSYFMEGSLPRYELNAALTPQDGYVNVLFPFRMNINLNNNFASLDNFIFPYQGGHVTGLHSSVSTTKFLKGIPEVPNIGMNFNYNLLGFGKYHKKHGYFWSFDLNLKAVADVNLSKDLFRILKDMKNGFYDMGDISMSAMAYVEVAYGITMPTAWENLVIGGRLKFLIGLGHMEAKVNTLTLNATQQEVRAVADGSVQGSIFGFDFRDIGENGQPMPFKELFKDGIQRWKDNPLDQLKENGFKSFGAAIDFGAEVSLFNKHLKLSAAVNDLGFIYWGGRNSIQGDLDDLLFEYRGYNSEKEDWDINSKTDIVLRKTGNSGYAKRLATTLNVGAEYSFGAKRTFGIGVLSHTKFWNRSVHSELTVTATVRGGKWFTMALSHTFLQQNKLGVFGAAFNIHPKGVNLFLGLDYIPTRFGSVDGVPYIPVSMKAFNLYMGMSFTPKGNSRGW